MRRSGEDEEGGIGCQMKIRMEMRKRNRRGMRMRQGGWRFSTGEGDEEEDREGAKERDVDEGGDEEIFGHNKVKLEP